MDAALSVILPPFGFLCKAKPLLLQIGGPSLIGVTANDSVLCASCPRGSEQDRTKRSKLRQAQRPHMVRLSGATGKRICARVDGVQLKTT